jgi:hypothetical protein
MMSLVKASRSLNPSLSMPLAKRKPQRTEYRPPMLPWIAVRNNRLHQMQVLIWRHLPYLPEMPARQQ